MRYNKAFFKGSRWTKYLISCIAVLFISTGAACTSNTPAQPPQAPDAPAAPQTSQAPESANPSSDPQAPDTPATPQTPQTPGSQTPANTDSQLSLEDARNAALTDAGIEASEATFTKEKLAYEDGVTVYELEFYTSTAEYEYEINAASGAVYSKSSETFHNSHMEHNNNERHHSDASSGSSSSDIGLENAKSIALNHAGLSADSVTFSKAEPDTDDGRPIYEIEFYYNGQEYEYKLLASDGSILEYEVD